MAFSEQRAVDSRFLKRHLRAIVALALSIAVLALGAGTASAIALPPGWSHAQVNVVIKHVAHTLYYDRGIITRVTPSSLTLRERDGSVLMIRVAPSATVTLHGTAVALGALRRGEFAQTVRVDGTPAQEVHARFAAPGGD
jgi:hypothetical protein